MATCKADRRRDTPARHRRPEVRLRVIAGLGGQGTALFGVRAVLAVSYERIHRSNLIGMGVLPLQFADGQDAAALGLTGSETYTIRGLTGTAAPPRPAAGPPGRASPGAAAPEVILLS